MAAAVAASINLPGRLCTLLFVSSRPLSGLAIYWLRKLKWSASSCATTAASSGGGGGGQQGGGSLC